MSFHLHHIIPKWRGGSDDSSNLVKVTHTQHLMFHYNEWRRTGSPKEYHCWRMMRGNGEDSKYIGGWNKGIPMAESTKQIQREQRLGVPNKNSGNNSWTNRRRAKHGEVTCIETGEVWTGVISDIARELGLRPEHLLAVAGGHRKTHKGYTARYII